MGVTARDVSYLFPATVYKRHQNQLRVVARGVEWWRKSRSVERMVS